MEATQSPPPRIEPFFNTPDDFQDFILLPPEEAELQQNGKSIKGKVRVVQQWSPFATFIEFEKDTAPEAEPGESQVESPSPAPEVEFGDAHVKSRSLDTTFKVVVKRGGGVEGFREGEIEVGSDHKLDRVTFHLPNYPDVFGGQGYDDQIVTGSTTTSLRWSEVVLRDDEWTIRLQPYPNTFALRQQARSHRATVLSGVGEFCRTNTVQFTKKDAKPVIEAIRVFLSFAFAEWMPPLLVVGSNAVARKSCQMWSSHDLSPQWYSRGWLDERHGRCLAEAFPGFSRLWKRQEWHVPFTQAVTWLIEASRLSGGTEGAIAFGQIPLEMLAWLVFVEDTTPILDADEFDKLSAANKLQLLLSHCGIPFDVPSKLKALGTVANGGDKKLSGPRIATEVRNTIIHPQKKNRDKLLGWTKKYAVDQNDLLWETQQLFKWYITLVLLRVIDYRGKYANRLVSHKLGEVESVPWVSP